jgi:hypothetical protein
LKEFSMPNLTRPRYALTALLLFALSLGLLGSSGFVYAADRTVVGELYSADN